MSKSVNALLSFCLLTLVVGAQETRSTINGRVYDRQASAIPGAAITITNSDTGAVTQLTTNETGYFEAPLLLPGNYKISASAAGFKTAIREGFALQLSQTLAIDLPSALLAKLWKSPQPRLCSTPVRSKPVHSSTMRN